MIDVKNLDMNKKTIVLIIVVVLVLGGLGFVVYNQFFPGNGSIPETGRLAEIKKRGEIIIGVDPTYPPMESLDKHGNFIGVDIDIVKEIAVDLGVKPIFKTVVWGDIFDAVRKGEVDIIISSVTITKERTEIMAFSDPYFNAGQVVVTGQDKEEVINGPQDLKGYKVGAQTETTCQAEAAKYVSDPSWLYTYENSDLAKEALIEGKIDAMVIDYPVAIGIIAEGKGLRIAGEIFTQEFYGIATQKDQPELLSQINKSIRRLKEEGEIRRIQEKWLGQ